MNKIKILGIIIGVAMIVLLSGGVAGYNDDRKNESEEELPDLTVSLFKCEGGIFKIEENDSIHFEYGRKFRREIERFRFYNLYIIEDVFLSNLGDKDSDNVAITVYLDGIPKEVVLLKYDSSSCGSLGRTTKERTFSINSNSEIHIELEVFSGIVMNPFEEIHNVTIKIDEDNKIKEINEDNNELSVIIKTKPIYTILLWNYGLVIALFSILILMILLVKYVKNKIKKGDKNESE